MFGETEDNQFILKENHFQLQIRVHTKYNGSRSLHRFSFTYMNRTGQGSYKYCQNYS